MKVQDFDYALPQELIAQTPLEKRDESRLLVLDKNNGTISHRYFKDILAYLRLGDVLVLNDTKVLPARIFGKKADTGAGIEFLLLKRRSGDIWEVILKPGRKAKEKSRFVFGEGLLEAEVIEIIEDGNRLVRFEYDGIFEEILDRIGHMPLPPYITATLQDKERYQTVFAKVKGSAAAPTAGLHFTNSLLSEIVQRGIHIEYVTLHVGLGTFRPVKVENIENHLMHAEYYSISDKACQTINQAKLRGNRVIAVGTTSVRVLETSSDKTGLIHANSGMTDIFIYPGYEFKLVDALITNFHLPQSTLLMLVSAFAGKEQVFSAYEEAIRNRYRFFSFGDAMLLT